VLLFQGLNMLRFPWFQSVNRTAEEPSAMTTVGVRPTTSTTSNLPPSSNEPEIPTTTPAAPTIADISDRTTSTSIAVLTPASAPENEEHGGSDDRSIGLGVGLGVGMAALVAAAFFVWRHWRAKERGPIKPPAPSYQYERSGNHKENPPSDAGNHWGMAELHNQPVRHELA
jgi:hypothetical protein